MKKIFKTILTITTTIFQLSKQLVLLNSQTISCPVDTISSDYYEDLEREPFIICASKTTLKIINYQTGDETTILTLDPLNDPEITIIKNYDNSPMILVGLSNMEVRVYDSEKAILGAPSLIRTHIHPKIHSQEAINPITAIDIRRNTMQFFSADSGDNLNAIFRFNLEGDGDNLLKQTEIYISEYHIVKIKHLEIFDWVAASIKNYTVMFYDFRLSHLYHGKIAHVDGNIIGNVLGIDGVYDKQMFLTGGDDGLVHLWDMKEVKDTGIISKAKTFDHQDPSNPGILALSYFEYSNIFVTLDRSEKVKVYEITPLDSAYTPKDISSTTYSGGFDIKTLPYTNKFFVGGKNNQYILHSDTLNCHEFCKTCEGINEFSCKTCHNIDGQPDIFELTSSKFCKRLCKTNEYYKSETNTCIPCHESCQNCLGGAREECGDCSSGYYKHPDGSCHLECVKGNYLSDPINKVCSPCHPECETCTGDSNQQCTSCFEISGYLLQIDNTCQKGCISHTFNASKNHCEKCHPQCNECFGGEDNNCNKCYEIEKRWLNEGNYCRDCLNDYDKDLKVCNHTVEFEFIRNPFESFDWNSSVSLKLEVKNYDYFQSSIEKVNWTKPIFHIEIPDFEKNEFYYTLEPFKKSLILNINLTKSIGFDPVNITLSTINEERLLDIDNRTGIGLFLLRNFTTKYEVKLIEKVADEFWINRVKSYANLLNIFNVSIFIVVLIVTISCLFCGIDLSPLLVDYVRNTKLLHRISLINIKYPILVEKFLLNFDNLFQIGDEYRRDQIDKYEKSFRGKLSVYGVPIFPLINFADKYFAYLIVLIVYFSFDQIRRYLVKGTNWKAVYERSVLRMIGRLKILFILMLSNDLYYSSMRTLLHQNTTTIGDSSQSLQGFITSFVMFLVLSTDVTTVVFDIVWNDEMDRIAFYNSPDRRLKFKTQFQKNPNLERSLMIIKNEDDSIDMSLVDKENENFKHLEILPQHGPDHDEIGLDYEKKYKFSSGIEFCIMGVKLEKLVTFVGRYYNMMLMLKYIAFEVIVMSTQETPLMQTTLFLIIELISIIFTITAIFKGVFKHRYIAIKNFVLDLALTLFFLYAFFISMCSNGYRSVCFRQLVTQRVMFYMIALIAFALLGTVLYLIWSGITQYKTKERLLRERLEKEGKEFFILIYLFLIDYERRRKLALIKEVDEEEENDELESVDGSDTEEPKLKKELLKQKYIEEKGEEGLPKEEGLNSYMKNARFIDEKQVEKDFDENLNYIWSKNSKDKLPKVSTKKKKKKRKNKLGTENFDVGEKEVEKKKKPDVKKKLKIGLEDDKGQK